MAGKGAPEQYWFKPGQSGNPAGRPPGSYSFKTMVKQKIREDGGASLVSIVDNLFKIAERGDTPAAAVSAIREIKLVLDGLESQTIVHVSDAVVSAITEWMDCWPISEEARADLVERLKGIA